MRVLMKTKKTVREEILAYITKHGQASIKQLVAYTGRSPQSIMVMTSKLFLASEIRRVGVGLYELPKRTTGNGNGDSAKAISLLREKLTTLVAKRNELDAQVSGLETALAVLGDRRRSGKLTEQDWGRIGRTAQAVAS